jgi:glyoxylase-like metal-dependent hydrolase (beta-lactamase superfamily II)
MNKLIILTIEHILNDNGKVSINPVILKGAKEMVLIDCGFPSFLPKIKESAMAQNMNIDGLTKVVITHRDIDHVGSLAELKREYPHIKILADIKEKSYINGEKEPIKAKKIREIYDSLPESQKEKMNAILRLHSAYEPVDIEGTLHDHDIFSWCVVT